MCYGTSSGTLTQLLHFGPLIAVFLISYITISGLYCLLLWWPPRTILSIIHLIVYCTWPIIIFHNYFNAIFLGPGFVPKNWRPENHEDEKYLQYCKKCESFKAPRSQCVLKMDHHCPWINTCVGHRNHSSFVYFVLFAPLGCLHAILVLGPSIYRALFRNYYIVYEIDVPIVKLNFLALIVCMFALGMAFGVSVAVAILFIVQMSSIWRNETGIESWIIKKALFRRKHSKNLADFIYPYHLGRKENFRQVFNWNGNWRPIGDGIWWNIRSDCTQFDLTIEQLAQKEEKRVQSVKYNVSFSYNGAFCPISKGFKVCCCIPWSDDPRLKLKTDEVVFVTRWQKHWYYGEKIVTDNKDEKNKIVVKGWFPSRCVNLHEDERAKYSEAEDDKKEN